MIKPVRIVLCGIEGDQQLCQSPYLCDEHGCQRLDPRCTGILGSRPSWMSPDQYDPCRCELPKDHDGPHQCKHTQVVTGSNPNGTTP